MANSTLTVTNSIFTDNISLNGVIQVNTFGNIIMSGNKFNRNMAYFEGNAINFNTFNTFTANNNIFFDNMGILYTSGTVTLKNGMTVTMSNNKFDNNMVG